MTSDEPKVGQVWHFLIGDDVSCAIGKIVNITDYTATIKVSEYFDPVVYARSKIEFIERVIMVKDSKYLCGND
jgi:hypothetical protein